MLRELLILRHGKSDWSGDKDDFNRPLEDRGKRAAQRAMRARTTELFLVFTVFTIGIGLKVTLSLFCKRFSGKSSYSW